MSPDLRQKLDKVTKEMLASLLARPDTWSAHYNVGNFYLDQGMIKQALAAFEVARKLEPRAIMPLVNSSMAYARGGDKTKAESMLKEALKLDPANAAANYNLGLLKAEMGDKQAAEKHLSAALKADPKMHQAAYNLGLLLHEKNPEDSLKLISKAYQINPNPRYAFTLAYFMNQAGDQDGAEKMLDLSVREWPWYADSYLLLADIQLAHKQKAKAVDLLQKAIKSERLAPMDRQRLIQKINSLKSKTKD